jgi:hypothetical protein
MASLKSLSDAMDNQLSTFVTGERDRLRGGARAAGVVFRLRDCLSEDLAGDSGADCWEGSFRGSRETAFTGDGDRTEDTSMGSRESGAVLSNSGSLSSMTLRVSRRFLAALDPSPASSLGEEGF